MLHNLLADENTIAARVGDGVGVGSEQVLALLPEEQDEHFESMHEPEEGHQAQFAKLLHELHEFPSPAQLFEYDDEVPDAAW